MDYGSEGSLEGSESGADPEAFEELWQRPSTIAEVGIDLRYFPSEDQAQAVADVVRSWLQVFGRILNLKRLLRLIVSYKYNEDLAEIDRGTKVSRVLKATNDDIAIGIAMTPTVIHEGEPRAIIIVNTHWTQVLIQPEGPDLEQAREHVIYALAHECGHVHDLEMRVVAFPGVILQTQLAWRDGVLFGIASGCWEEYIACRLSAFMPKVATLSVFEETFCKALEVARMRANSAIRQYRMHHDVTRAADEVSSEYKRVLVYASYLLGHVDGLDRVIEDAAPRALKALDNHAYFKLFFGRLHAELQALHGEYGNWKNMDVFEPLKRLAYDLLKFGGIDIQVRPNGAYVDIPLTPETVPTPEEQLAFISGRP